jgi:hypothetical protein
MPNDIKKLRRLMKSAHHLQKQNPVILKGTPIDRRNALKYAWWFESFRTKLSTGIYRFSYFKKEGGIREAVGTLDLSRIPAEHHPKSLFAASDDSPKNYETFRYYDLIAAGWRSFCLDLFIGFVEEVKA